MTRRLAGCYFAFMLLTYLPSSAQQFGGNPSSLKWKQINTDTVRIIFPAGIEPTANRVASVIHELQKNHSATIGSKLRKISIVLQNQNTLANGYVGLGPWRSEFYLYAPQNSFEQGSVGWADKLALHEYRHVQQFANFNVGLSKLASVILGQEGQALANSAAVPDYFFEGDAVFNETILTEQGRGRQPLFLNGYKTLFNQDKQYSYQKLRNGSFKDYVPDHYQLGYLMVGYGREKYGKDFWKNVSQDAARFKPLLYPWQGAVKKFTGKPYKQFVNDAFNYYHALWKSEPVKQGSYLTPQTKYRSDYKYPAISNDESIIVLKSSYRQVPAFYRILPNGVEEKISTRDITYEDYFSYSNNKIVFATLKPDARWGYKEFSDIKVLNVQTGKAKKITAKERFFSPAISHDGHKIAVVEMKTNQLSNLLVIDTLGKRQFRMNGTAGVVYSFPAFSANDSMIYTAVRNAKGEMALQQINLLNSKTIDVLSFDTRIIGYPVVNGDTILFTSTYKGSDELWAYLEKTRAVYRVARQSGGLYHATINPLTKQVVAATFTADGYRLVNVPANLNWQKVENKAENLPDLYLPTALAAEPKNVSNTIPARDFTIKNYSKGYRFFNFHSWRPYYDQPEFSFTVYGQNVLNTFQSELAYAYNKNEGSNKLGLNFIYGGWYVQPTLGSSKTWNRTINYNRDTTLFYNESEVNFGLRIPLNFSGGKHYTFLTMSSNIFNKGVQLNGIAKKIFPDKNFNYLQQRVLFSSQTQKAVQQIYPHFAQSLLLQYRNIINKYTANQFLASGNLYLPGIHTNHSIVINAAYAARDTAKQYYFSNDFPFSRGYKSVDFPRMWRFGINYHVPLWYADLGVANIVYLKRVRANAFYDYTQTKSLRTGSKFFFSTVGTEIFFDTRWWNQQSVTFGVRYSWLQNKEFRGVTRPNQWEFILPVNLF